LLESVQHRATTTKPINNLRKLLYEERLKLMDLPKLAYRRLCSDDATETYKFPRGLYSVNLSVLLLWWKKP